MCHVRIENVGLVFLSPSLHVVCGIECHRAFTGGFQEVRKTIYEGSIGKIGK